MGTVPPPIEAAESAAQVEAIARWIWGPTPLLDEGVVQPMAVVADGGRVRVLRIGPHAPKSTIDAFVLGYTRARVDAIVTSGATVRAEPGERYGLNVGPGLLSTGLERARREVAGRNGPPIVAVITSGRKLDLDQPLFDGAGEGGRRVCIYTGPEGGARLEGAARRRGIELVVVEVTSIADVLRRLRSREGCRLVSVEAGPSATRPLYAIPGASDREDGPGAAGPPGRAIRGASPERAAADEGRQDAPFVDELLLSRFLGPEVDREGVGPALMSEASLAAGYPVEPPDASRTVDEASGPWRFERRRRTTGAASQRS